MLTTLHIKNIGIIEEVSIDLQQGFNVLTGATGAGKSLIMDSLALLAGGRFSKEMMRKGESFCFVEACLYLPRQEQEDSLIISREIYVNGRNLCKINGRMATVAELKDFMEQVIDIHGQNENQSILEPKKQLSYLDDYAGNGIKKCKEQYEGCYESYQQLRKQLANNYGDEKEKQRKLDLLQYQVSEIKEANLKEEEEESLENQRKRILHAEKITQNLAQVEEQLGETVLDGMNTAIRALEKIEELDENYANMLSSLKSSYYDLQEMARDVSSYKEDGDFDEGERKQVEERLDLLFSLKRKYGNTIPEILAYQKEITQEIQKIENLEEYTNQMKEQIKKIEEQMKLQASKMQMIRKEQANLLVEKVNQELQDLEMGQAKFMVHFEEQKEYSRSGIDKVEFYIATNIGEDEKPLAKVASGGEMSRIMLAIKTVLANIDEVPVLIFDEIDTGISGSAAKKVGTKLKKIGETHQVLVVTHQASIAAKGQHHYYIYKEVKQEKTETKVRQLKEKESIEEIAKMASGEITTIAIEHAKELKRVG